MTMTTHDTYAERYMQEYVAPEDVPRVLIKPAPPLADLEACMRTDQQPAPDQPTPAPTSETADASADNGEQTAPPMSRAILADALKRLADVREQITIAESDLAAIAANLAGHD
jgi:hypothetical protein